MIKKMALNCDDIGNSWSSNWDKEKHFSGSGKCESKGFSDAVHDDDIVDRLPADPFGMEITLTAAITGWIQGDQSSFFKGVNWVWNGNFEINGISKTQNQNDDFNGGAAPNDALFFALGYLGVKDLLSVERVCRSFRDAVRSDTLLWRSINVENSLSKKISDDSLLKLTSRAQGTLACLSLVGCVKISDGGLNRVLETSPRLTKLSVPECTSLTVEGILCNLRAFRSDGSRGIKHLRIGGRFDVTEEQFKELKLLVGVDNSMQSREQKPRFFRQGILHSMSDDDDRAIDIEVCPRCQKLKLVYDCSSDSCRRTHDSAQLCRACILCIARCICCGCCFKDCDYEETFNLDLLCFNCRKQNLNRENTIFQETRYQFCVYG